MGESGVRTFFGRYVISLGVTASLMVGMVAAVNRGIDNRVQGIHRIKVQLAPPPPQGANFLIIGSDGRSFVKTAGDAAAFGDPSTDANLQGQRSDTLMVAHVEPDTQRTFVLSFPRDLMVNVPGIAGKSRINTAYATGGPNLVIETLQDNFQIPINHYLEVNFKSFQEIVDAIGNVRVYLPGKVRDSESGLNTPFGAGCYPLNGVAALAYVRSRSLQVADPNGSIVDPDTGERWRLLDVRADLDRIPRQQAFMRKLAGLAIQRSLGDPFLAVDLADRVLRYIKADQALSRGDVNALIRAFRTVDVNDQNAVRFETLPVDPDPNNPNVTLVPAAAADAVIAQLRTFANLTPRSPNVAPSQVTVRVADGSGLGFAQSVVDALGAEGFHASIITGARTGVTATEIRYGPGQSARAKALLDYVTDARLVADAKLTGSVELVLGTTFSGSITVPPTTTTVPGAPVTTTTTPPTTTTTIPASEACR
ncbi:MAG: LCP family protein [Acidimicrobiia bacterium]